MEQLKNINSIQQKLDNLDNLFMNIYMFSIGKEYFNNFDQWKNKDVIIVYEILLIDKDKNKHESDVFLEFPLYNIFTEKQDITSPEIPTGMVSLGEKLTYERLIEIVKQIKEKHKKHVIWFSKHNYNLRLKIVKYIIDNIPGVNIVYPSMDLNPNGFPDKKQYKFQ